MSAQYDLYLQQHKANVCKGFQWMFWKLPDLLKDVKKWTVLLNNIEFDHDNSKLNPDEYEAYDDYFYGGNRSHKVVEEFNKAWLHHIHHNPHHWQYWVIINDDPGEGMTLLDIPFEYIIEMICDWWSFSWQKGNLFEIFDWYDKHREYMKLSPKTRNTVESILKAIKEKLLEETSADKEKSEDNNV